MSHKLTLNNHSLSDINLLFLLYFIPLWKHAFTTTNNAAMTLLV